MDSKLNSRIRSALRRVWMWSGVRTESIRSARVGYGKYACALCKCEVGVKEKKVDHIEPITPLEGIKSMKDWGIVISRLFDIKNHQVLCGVCHSKKTKAENAERRKRKSG